MGLGNLDIEGDLEKLPDLVADALEKWRIATLDREKREALLYLTFERENRDQSATEIKARIHASDTRYDCVLNELKREADYKRVYERLMSLKKRCDLRTAC